MKRPAICLVILYTLGVVLYAGNSWSEERLPVAAQMTTDLAGNTAAVAVPSVYRLVIQSKNKSGTAFLHKSGVMITAAHVVEGCSPVDVIAIDANGQKTNILNIIANVNLDLAILKPEKKVDSPALQISVDEKFSIGLQVSTWGYPAGYNGGPPLLMSGYLSGIDREKTTEGKLIPRWVVNAAFNNGNSGGPLIDIEKGTVIGVVSSKLAPIPHDIEIALEALKNQKSGLIYIAKKPDGTELNLTEAQIVEMVLQYLRSQTQLVIGYAVMLNDLRTFLKEQHIDP
jgi:S1-C subfamily serine protease